MGNFVHVKENVLVQIVDIFIKWFVLLFIDFFELVHFSNTYMYIYTKATLFSVVRQLWSESRYICFPM